MLISIMTSCASRGSASIAVEKTLGETLDQTLSPKFEGANSIWDSVEIKANWFTKNLKPYRNLNQVPKDFAEFYAQFISDSIFQLQHIAYDKLIGVIGHCDTTIRFTKVNWEYNNWDYTKFFNEDNNTDNIDGWDNTFYFTNKRFYYQFRLKEIGWIYKTGFEKIKGKWQLTLYDENAC